MTTITFHSDNTSRQRREAMMFGLLRVAAGILHGGRHDLDADQLPCAVCHR